MAQMARYTVIGMKDPDDLYKKPITIAEQAANAKEADVLVEIMLEMGDMIGPVVVVDNVSRREVRNTLRPDDGPLNG